MFLKCTPSSDALYFENLSLQKQTVKEGKIKYLANILCSTKFDLYLVLDVLHLIFHTTGILRLSYFIIITCKCFTQRATSSSVHTVIYHPP